MYEHQRPNFPDERAAWADRIIDEDPRSVETSGTIRVLLVLIALSVLVWLLTAVRLVHGAETFTARVVELHDADTMWIDRGGIKTKVRLAWVDAPEIGQPDGVEARAFAAKLLLDKIVTISHGKAASYGRPVVQILLADQSGYNAALVQAGHAWVDQRYSKSKLLLGLQAEAQAAKRGLWAMKNPTPPWLWRKAHHGGAAK